MLAEMWIIEENRLLLPCKNLNNFRIIFLRRAQQILEKKKIWNSGPVYRKLTLHELLPGFYILYALVYLVTATFVSCFMTFLFLVAFFSLSMDLRVLVFNSRIIKNATKSRNWLPARLQNRFYCVFYSARLKKIVIIFFLWVLKWRIFINILKTYIIIDPSNIDKCTLHEYLSSI